MTAFAPYPTTRLRRNRRDDWCRQLVAENHLRVEDLVWPLFVREETEGALIPSLPGVERHCLSSLIDQAGEAVALGIKAVALFPVVCISKRTLCASEALNGDGLYARAIAMLKKHYPMLGVISDVALDPFTNHGQDGLITGGYIDNDTTVAFNLDHALLQAKAGADIIAPSEMMDGRIGAIRSYLDQHGYHHVRLLSYCAKYASSFYGPYRDALQTKSLLGMADKKTYQLDPANSDEAIREGLLDLSEGADMLMVKPGLPYLDIIYRFKETLGVPIFAYQVSGEYAMIKAAAERGWINEMDVLLESLMAFKRAGADGIFTYGALDVAKRLAAG